ncbi:MAG TPA: class I SAM-dependent methyltransferase [Candidatus Methanoperedens sp.]|nr:class I SAM-dependent methyltransferase [Candidatus Methanoperedens sp.]
MELLKNISDQIQTNLTSNFHIRARYLHDLYRPLLEKVPNKNNYMDLGCGFGVNSAVFGEGFNIVYCSDLSMTELGICRKNMREKKNYHYIAADAQSLPFKNEYFDLVTAFSLIEHVPCQEKMLREAFRILKNQGQLVLQFPNKHFFMELHTGIPFFCLVPDFMKTWILEKKSYDGFLNIPTPEQVKDTIHVIDPSVNVRVVNVIYPDDLVPVNFKKVYSLLKKTGIFRKIPFGWLVICEKP